jgi:serine/threonine protein kinase
MPLSPGDRLGPYEILSPLGAGGMGEVYKARDTRLDRTVAVKVLPKYIADRDDLRARFEREARAVASLKHPNICVLHDIGKQDGIDFMVLEHLEGETLAARAAKGPLPLDQVLKYATQIADALDRAHRSGVNQRDVKPANIMLTRDGIKVLDFGLAKAAPKVVGPDDVTRMPDALTGEGTILGTPVASC